MRIASTTSQLAYWYDEKTALRMLKDAGFDAVDLSMFFDPADSILAREEAEVTEHYADMKAYADAIGIGFAQAHSPFPTYVENAVKDEQIFTATKNAVAACGAVRCPYVVVHPLMPKSARYERDSARARQANIDFFTRLLPWLEKYDVKVGIENMFGSDPHSGLICPTTPSYAEQMIDYIDSMNQIAGAERFVACLDTGHMTLVRRSAQDEARKLGHRLKLLHVHDNNGMSDQHILPYEGRSIDWRAFALALGEIGYSGDFSLEADNTLAAFPIAVAPEVLRMMAAVAREIAEQI